MKSAVLWYSGSWDTTICLHYLKNVRGFRVISFCAKFGYEDPHELLSRNVQLGADATHIVDLTKRFVNEVVVKAIRAHIIYEDYYLSVALTRPLIVEEMLKVAKDEGCDYAAHGASFKANDYIRLRNLVSSLMKKMKIVSPLEELGISNLSDAQRYAEREGISLLPELRVAKNIWGDSMKIKDQDEVKRHLKAPIARYKKPATVSIQFEDSLPVAINGRKMDIEELIRELNRIGSAYNIGAKITLEDNLRGRKELFLYNAPAADIIFHCVRQLGRHVFDKRTLDIRRAMSTSYAELIYEGKWFIPVRHAMDRFFLSLSKRLAGTVTVELGYNAMRVKSVESKYSLI